MLSFEAPAALDAEIGVRLYSFVAAQFRYPLSLAQFGAHACLGIQTPVMPREVFVVTW